MKRMIAKINSAGKRAKAVPFPFSGKTSKRVISVLLCVCMAACLLCNLGGGAAASNDGFTQKIVPDSRMSDGNTMESYVNKLLSSNDGSRYAGRVWTDKSVFAHNGSTDGTISLENKNDGYEGTVNFDSDFGTVFSALSSSQRIDEYSTSPVDVLFLVDMSGSMAEDVKDGASHSDYNEPNPENSKRITHSRIYNVLQSINNSIQKLMDMGEDNRVAVVGYGASAYTLLELGHYKPATTGKYLEVKNFRRYYYLFSQDTRKPEDSGSATYMVGTVAGLKKLDSATPDADYKRYARNDYKSTKFSCDPTGTVNIGFSTDMQAGIYQGVEELYKNYDSIEDVREIYESEETGKKTAVQRVPIAIVMTDGGSNYALKRNSSSSTSGDEWYNVQIYSGNIPELIGNYTKYRTENGGGDVTILDILLTASYEKSKMQNKYTKLVQQARGDEEYPLPNDPKKNDFRIYTLSVDTPNEDWQMPRVYSTLDPVDFFSNTLQEHDGIDPSKWAKKQDVIDAYNLFLKWEKADSSISKSFTDSDKSRTVKFNQLPADKGVTKDDIIKNINYNYEFANIKASAIDKTFDDMLGKIRGIAGSAFTPFSGYNDAGVKNSITYKDPLGEYMELKNGSITVNGDVTSNGAASANNTAFDMSMLLYGEMRGMVRAGVYDYHWNTEYISNHSGEKVEGDNKDPFPLGWYKGEDPENAYKAAKTAENDSGSWPTEDPVTGTTYTSAEEAWADGWVMRFDFNTLLDFVPIANAKEDGSTINPDALDESIKNTVYTCYRFADTQQERNKLRCNPIFGDVPEELQNTWNDYYDQNKSYPTDSDMYSSYPGVYRLSDIRVWEEHTGDFIDQTGSITPEDQSGYDDLLYVNLPVSATPIQLAEIALGKDGPISYKDNLSDKKQSTPFRLFYAVGLTEDLIIRDGGTQTGVDVSKISGEYISTHSDPDSGNISFISNWYSNTVYHGYAGDDDGSTRGDAGVSFSPDAENRYYLFQKPLPLSAHAYRVLNDSGDVAPVDKADGEDWGANGAGNGSTTWETVGDAAQSAASWVGGEFIGTYKDDASFKAALKTKTQQDGDVSYITDDKGKVYPLPATLTGAIITYTGDQLSDVDANADGEGYADGAKSFSSDDYFFLCIEYYMPMDGTGKDIYGNDDAGTQAVRKVYRMIARKGSAFGSGLPSENINNGDMLCWTDINHKYKLEIEYNSRTDTGDITRGRPTLEKLTLQDTELREYLQNECKLDNTKNIEIKDPTTGAPTFKTYLELDVDYWENVQKDPHMAELIEDIETAATPEAKQAKFNELFDWSVAAKTGGIRVGDMHNNVQAKVDNATKTASNYYVPTLSETSTAGSGLVINNYLGNNGRMEIANANLIVTKTLAAPDGFKLTKEQEENEEFEYQVFEGEMAGERLAQRLKWNPFSNSWQKRIESLDILTDNSSLLLDTNGKRALFCYTANDQTPEQVVEVINGDEIKYVYAYKSGKPTEIECNEAPEKLYYMYLPSNNSGDSNLTYHLFSSRYEGGDGYDGTTERIDGAGTTAYYPEGTNIDDMAHNENQHFATAAGDLTAGSREYWTTKAELIPYQNVYAAENPSDSVEGNTESIRWDHATNPTSSDYISLSEFTLVTVIPDTNGVESKVYSPYSSRTQYMTVPLYFGYNSKLAEHLKAENETFATCQHTGEYKLTTDDLYDQTAGNTETTAQHTANFTLKSGEGLLLTGLGNEAAYRFTEKLTDTQREQGYVLQSVNQVPQSGNAPLTPPDPDNGVYSVSGDTDSSTTEQTHYTNTFEPELFVLTKSMVDQNNKDVTVAPNEEFTFTLTFTPTDEANMTDMDGTLYYWKGNKKDYTSALEWTDANGNSYKMPQNAPPLSKYKDYLTSKVGEQRLATITPVEGKYTVNLKANEAIVFYGLIAGTNFTVTETENAKYPVVPDGSYAQTGTIKRADENPDASDPAKTPNRANFTNRLQSGILTVEKRIKNTEPDSTQEFKFTVSLSGTGLTKDVLNAVKYKASGTSDPDFTLSWSEAEGGGLQANVTLRHGEKLMIEGIPLDTEYTVTETDKGDYNLQHVANNTDDKALNDNGDYLTLTGDGVSGEITNSDSQAYLLFVNEKTASMPFAGGIGFDGIIITGILLIGLAMVLAGLQMRRSRRKRRNARNGGVRK